MDTFGLLGFVFGVFTFSLLITLPPRIKDLEVKVKELEKVIENKQEENSNTEDKPK